METPLQLQERQRIERLKAQVPPISPALMPLIILVGGVLLAWALFAMGAEFIFVVPTFAIFGFAIFSLNAFVVRKRLERLDEAHLIERKKYNEKVRAGQGPKA